MDGIYELERRAVVLRERVGAFLKELGDLAPAQHRLDETLEEIEENLAALELKTNRPAKPPRSGDDDYSMPVTATRGLSFLGLPNDAPAT